MQKAGNTESLNQKRPIHPRQAGYPGIQMSDNESLIKCTREELIGPIKSKR